MIVDLKPYPVMKDSGLPWLGCIPEHWSVCRFKRICSRSALYGANISSESYATSGVRFIRTTDITEDGRLKDTGVYLPKEAVHDYLLTNGDILISRSGTIGRSFLYNADKHGSCAYAGYLVRFIPSSDVIPNYVFLYTKTEAFFEFLHEAAISSTIENVNGEKYANAQLPLPPLSEQSAIVRFLDHADRRIRRYIHAKQKLIKLLEEQKQAINHHAVTRGIDPNVPLKPSGVEWLGDVPKHWVVAALRHRYSQCLGKMLDSKKITGKYPLPYLRNIDVQWDRIDIKDLPIMDISPEEYERYTIKKGDLLVCEGGDVGRCALWSDEMPLCGFQKALHRLRPRCADQDVPRFMYYLLRAAAKCDAFNDGHLSTIAHLTGDKLRTHRFSFPPKFEQDILVNFLDITLDGIDKAISSTLCEIRLLHEYRTRLISDVVTGKLDVRGIDLHAPDHADAPEEYNDLLDSEVVTEDQELQEEIPVESD